MSKFINWLIWSSKDPQKIALTVKGFLSLGIVTVVAHQLGLDNLYNSGNIDTITEIIVLFIQLAGTIAGSWGVLRKTTNTINNNNQ